VVARRTVLKEADGRERLLHAGEVVTMAEHDAAMVRCGRDHGPPAFNTIELKSNFWARRGRASSVHGAAPAPGPHNAGLGRGVLT